jgi:hypothetical protein
MRMKKILPDRQARLVPVIAASNWLMAGIWQCHRQFKGEKAAIGFSESWLNSACWALQVQHAI